MKFINRIVLNACIYVTELINSRSVEYLETILFVFEYPSIAHISGITANKLVPSSKYPLYSPIYVIVDAHPNKCSACVILDMQFVFLVKKYCDVSAAPT